LDFFHRPVFKKEENTTFRKLDLFPSSGEEGRYLISWAPQKELISPVIVISSFYGAQLSRCLPPHLRTETDPVSEKSCFLLSIIPDDGKKIQKPSDSVCYTPSSFIQGIRPGPRLLVVLRNKLIFYGEELLAPRPTPKLEDHPLREMVWIGLIWLRIGTSGGLF
jgi:hypothetical protein